jgi:carboxylesterase type B
MKQTRSSHSEFTKLCFKNNSTNKFSYYYNNLRAYALSYYDPYTSCTFPVGKPNTPYYRCHSGDIYQVFGTYYTFDQPIRTAADIGHKNLQQDMWGAFARTGDPNPAKEYLRARGYTDSLALFERFHWLEFNGRDSMNIDFPEPFMSDLPWKGKCGVVEQLFQLP